MIQALSLSLWMDWKAVLPGQRPQGRIMLPCIPVFLSLDLSVIFLHLIFYTSPCLLAGIVHAKTNSKRLRVCSFLLLLFCFVVAFLPQVPKETSKYKGKKAMLRIRVKTKQKRQKGKKKKKIIIKEVSNGPGELSSRGLGFLQNKFRYMFVCLHFQIGAVCARSEEKNKSNANFRECV